MSTKFKVLLAEDDCELQDLVSRKLEKNGFEVIRADDGYMVIESLFEDKFDLILMDLDMPNLNGVEATQRIIEAYGDERPVIAALTGSSSEDLKEQCMNIGMDCYLVKPLKKSKIQELYEACLKKQNKEELQAAS